MFIEVPVGARQPGTGQGHASIANDHRHFCLRRGWGVHVPRSGRGCEEEQKAGRPGALCQDERATDSEAGCDGDGVGYGGDAGEDDDGGDDGDDGVARSLDSCADALVKRGSQGHARIDHGLPWALYNAKDHHRFTPEDEASLSMHLFTPGAFVMIVVLVVTTVIISP